MSEIQTIIEHARALIEDSQYGEAQELLATTVAKHPDNADLNTELGLIFCYLQKEFAAAELLPRTVGAVRHPVLAEILRDYFYCRKQLASRLKVADTKADELAKIVAKYAPGKPEGVGIKLSACLIVKNEEKHLDRCLASVKPLVDEIIVVDTGSTDQTVKIAEKYGATVGHFEWCDDFAAARNESLRLATGNWILWIDADEELDPISFDQMREALIRPQFAGYYIQIINLMDANVDASRYVHTAVRLFRNIPSVRFTGRIHEQIINGFRDLGLVPATLTKAAILHHGYQAADMTAKNKIERTISMLEKEVLETEEEPFHWFNLANAYSVAMRPQDAEKAAQRCVALITKDAPYGPALFQILTSSLTAIRRAPEALHFCEVAVERGYDSIINQFERSHALYEMGRYDEALAGIDHSMTMDWPIDLIGDIGIKTYKSHVLRGQILCALGRYKEAEESLDFALEKHPGFGMAVFAKATLLEQIGELTEAFDLYRQASASPGLQLANKYAGRVAMKSQRFADAATVLGEFWQQNTDDAEAWLGWVQACESAEDFKAAAAAYAAIDENTLNADLLVNWGRALQLSGDTSAALQKFGLAVEREPNNANAYFNCGDLLYKMGHYQEAAGIYELGLKRAPKNAQAWFVLGNCFAQMNIPKGATTSYNQALALCPEHEEARHNLSLITQDAA
jgi:tetratricopeptide (TPR) repeat protein